MVKEGLMHSINAGAFLFIIIVKTHKGEDSL